MKTKHATDAPEMIGSKNVDSTHAHAIHRSEIAKCLGGRCGLRESEKKLIDKVRQNVAIDCDSVRAFNNRGNEAFHNSGEQYERPFCHRMVISAFNRWSSLREMLMKTFHEHPACITLRIPAKITQVRPSRGTKRTRKTALARCGCAGVHKTHPRTKRENNHVKI